LYTSIHQATPKNTFQQNVIRPIYLVTSEKNDHTVYMCIHARRNSALRWIFTDLKKTRKNEKTSTRFCVRQSLWPISTGGLAGTLGDGRRARQKVRRRDEKSAGMASAYEGRVAPRRFFFSSSFSFVLFFFPVVARSPNSNPPKLVSARRRTSAVQRYILDRLRRNDEKSEQPPR